MYQVYQVYLLYMPERAIATDDIELLAVVVGSVTSDLPPQVTASTGSRRAPSVDHQQIPCTCAACSHEELGRVKVHVRGVVQRQKPFNRTPLD